MKAQNIYKTTSLALASAINAVSTAKLHCIDFTNPNRAEFVFDRSEDPSFDTIIEHFWSKNLPCDCSTFFESQRYIKSRLYSEQAR